MIVVTNRIPVTKGHEIDFEDRFRNRVHLVDQAPGFVRNEVHRPRPMKFDHETGQFVADPEAEGYVAIHAPDGVELRQELASSPFLTIPLPTALAAQSPAPPTTRQSVLKPKRFAATLVNVPVTSSDSKHWGSMSRSSSSRDSSQLNRDARARSQGRDRFQQRQGSNTRSGGFSRGGGLRRRR